MRITYISICLLLAAGVTIGGATAGGSTTADISLIVEAPDTAAPGDKVTIRVRLAANKPLYGIQYTLSYDPTVLNVQRVTKGGFLSQTGSSLVLSKKIDSATGEIDYGEIRQGASDGVTGTGTTTVITAVVTADSPTEETQLRFSEVKAANPNGQPMQTTTSTTMIDIQSSATSSSTGSTNGGNAKTTTSASKTWRDKLSKDVREQLTKSEAIPVIVVVTSEEDLAVVAAALESAGAKNADQLESIHAVSVRANHTVLKRIAQLDSVKRIRYDSRATVKTTRATSKAETTTLTKSGPSTTQTSGNGFGPTATLGAFLLILAIRLKKLSQ